MNTKCMICGTEMEERYENRAYSPAPGLVTVTLKNTLVLYCPECGEEEVGITAIYHLHRAIAKAVATKESRLTPEEIRFLRSHMGWSSSEFARQFEVSRETASRWENGKQKIGQIAEKLLRMYTIYLEPKDEEIQPLKLGDGEPQPLSRLQLDLVEGEWLTEPLI